MIKFLTIIFTIVLCTIKFKLDVRSTASRGWSHKSIPPNLILLIEWKLVMVNLEGGIKMLSIKGFEFLLGLIK